MIYSNPRQVEDVECFLKGFAMKYVPLQVVLEKKKKLEQFLNMYEVQTYFNKQYGTSIIEPHQIIEDFKILINSLFTNDNALTATAIKDKLCND